MMIFIYLAVWIFGVSISFYVHWIAGISFILISSFIIIYRLIKKVKLFSNQ